MTRGVLWGTVGVWVVVLSAGLRAASDREQRQIMAELRMLQEQTQRLQLAVGELAEALKAITARLDEQAGTTRKGFADQKLLIDAVAEGVRVLREKVDDSTVRLASLVQEVEALRVAMPAAAPPAAETPPGASPAPPAAAPPAGTPPPAPPAAPGGATAPAGSGLQPGVNPQRLWDEAFGDYTAGRWSLAVTGFENYIRYFPRSALADDAQFYIGAALQLEGKYQEAVAAFDKVIVNYPGADSVPQALFKRGACYEALKQLDRAQQSYEMVIKNFPETDAAFLAKQALDRLKKQ